MVHHAFIYQVFLKWQGIAKYKKSLSEVVFFQITVHVNSVYNFNNTNDEYWVWNLLSIILNIMKMKFFNLYVN